MATVVSGPEGMAAPRTERAAGIAWAPERQAVLLRRLALALLAVGVLWRVGRYLLRFPICGDEAVLCLNFLELDYRGLLRELHYGPAAPLLFLWGELTTLRLLGGGELAMRLLPFLAGLGSLFLFWRLARLTLRPLAATLALGFLAVAAGPVAAGTFAGPHAFDLLMSLALLVPAAWWLRSPNRRWRLAVLTMLTPVALFGSYPAAFVGGAVSLGLLTTAWRQGRNARLLFAAYNLTLVASFLGHYATAGKVQLQTPTLRVNAGADVALTLFLCLPGAWHFWRSGRRPLLVLCVAPFALSLPAAALHRYPYGGATWLAEHLAPAVCLLAGAGAAALIGRLRSGAARRRWVIGAAAAFLLVGLVGLGKDVIKPYGDVEARWARDVMRTLRAEAGAGAPVVVLNPREGLDSVFRWHLGLLGERVSWGGNVDWDRAAAAGEVNCLLLRSENLRSPNQLPRAPAQVPAEVYSPLAAWLQQSGRPWVLKKAVTEVGVPPNGQGPVKHLDQYRWVLPEGGAEARR
jgi:hypothetical protein